MYLPKAFAEPDRSAAVEMARAVAFGHLVVSGPDGPMSTPMPFVLTDSADDTLEVRGHLARANPVLGLLPGRALLIVPGTDAYISPSWYPSKQEHARVVPTWNYEVVHLHGELEARETEWTDRLVRDLTDLHEAERTEPWAVDDAPADFIAKQLKAIVGVSLAVDRVEAKRKLSQNRSAEDAGGAADGLDDEGTAKTAAIADSMRRHHPER